jgi:hypothetical protein
VYRYIYHPDIDTPVGMEKLLLWLGNLFKSLRGKFYKLMTIDWNFLKRWKICPQLFRLACDKMALYNSK